MSHELQSYYKLVVSLDFEPNKCIEMIESVLDQLGYTKLHDELVRVDSKPIDIDSKPILQNQWYVSADGSVFTEYYFGDSKKTVPSGNINHIFDGKPTKKDVYLLGFIKAASTSRANLTNIGFNLSSNLRPYGTILVDPTSVY